MCRRHGEQTVRRFGRAALFESTEYGAFLALRLREAYDEIQVEQTVPFNEFTDVEAEIREAAAAYANRDESATPYASFATGTDHPDPESMKSHDL